MRGVINRKTKLKAILIDTFGAVVIVRDRANVDFQASIIMLRRGLNDTEGASRRFPQNGHLEPIESRDLEFFASLIR